MQRTLWGSSVVTGHSASFHLVLRESRSVTRESEGRGHHAPGTSPAQTSSRPSPAPDLGCRALINPLFLCFPGCGPRPRGARKPSPPGPTSMTDGHCSGHNVWGAAAPRSAACGRAGGSGAPARLQKSGLACRHLPAPRASPGLTEQLPCPKHLEMSKIS